MANEKYIVKMTKMVHKKTGASFLVVYVISVSLVYTDSKKTVMFTPPTYHLCNFWKAIKLPTCTHTVTIPLCPGQYELAFIFLFVQFNNQLDV